MIYKLTLLTLLDTFRSIFGAVSMIISSGRLITILSDILYLTRASSKRDPITNIKHTPIHNSLAFTYGTNGKSSLIPENCVINVKIIVIPSVSLVGN